MKENEEGSSEMRITFLGTGPAWGHPELGCSCSACDHARRNKGKDWRRRTALLIETSAEKLLIDCGPDIREQLMGNQVGSCLDYEPIDRFDALLITHSHTDHINGLDELSALRRSNMIGSIPTYATEPTWKEILRRFGYLVGGEDGGRLLIRGTALVGVELIGLQTSITPFAVEHGPTAPGAVGYIFQAEGKKVVYTGDFYDVPIRDERLKHPDLLIIECNWFNEPEVQPVTSWHMSFQRARSFIQEWEPKRALLVHISHEDFTRTPKAPLLRSPPKSHDEWRQAVRQFSRGVDIEVAYDGMSLVI